MRIARALGAPGDERTTLITVTPRARTDVLLGSAYAVTIHQDAKDVLGAAREDAGRLPVATREVVDRSVARGLIRAAAEEDADLLVVGRRGRAPTLRASMAERLAAQAPCPVVSVPVEWAPRRPLTRVGVLALPAPEGLPVLAVAARLAAQAAASVRIISTVELPATVELACERDPTIVEPLYRDKRASLDAALASFAAPLRDDCMFRTGRASAIAREPEEQLDLLVVGRRSWRSLSLAPVGRLLRRCARPVVLSDRAQPLATTARATSSRGEPGATAAARRPRTIPTIRRNYGRPTAVRPDARLTRWG